MYCYTLTYFEIQLICTVESSDLKLSSKQTKRRMERTRALDSQYQITEKAYPTETGLACIINREVERKQGSTVPCLRLAAKKLPQKFKANYVKLTKLTRIPITIAVSIFRLLDTLLPLCFTEKI